MDSLSELEWTSALQGLLTPGESATDETYRKQAYSSRQCPHCNQYTLTRHPLPNHLRLLRRFGIDFRHYFCVTCSRNTIMRYR